MAEIVKVGMKKKHVKIPEGWHRVLLGPCQAGDRYCHTSTLASMLVEEDDIGLLVEDGHFDLLIRVDEVLPA